MRDWILVIVIAAIGLGIGIAYWAMRRGAPARVGGAVPGSGWRTTEPEAEAPARSDSRLAVLEFEGEPGFVSVTRPEVVIGRHSEDDIQVRDVRISRHHARLVAQRDGGFEIHNLTAVRSEPNPMQVNGVTREHASLQDGDIVSLGGVNFTLWLKAA